MTMSSEGGGKLTNIVRVRYGPTLSQFYIWDAPSFIARLPWNKIDMFEKESLDGVEITFDDLEYVKHGDYELYSYHLSCFFKLIYHWLKPGGYVKVKTGWYRVDSLMDYFKISKYPRIYRSFDEARMVEIFGIKKEWSD